MEQTKEKKEMKIGLSTIIIIITLIIIVVMSYYIYKVSEAKKVSDQKVEKLSEQVDELENTINAISTTISQSQTPPMVYAYDKTGNRTGIMGTTLEGVNIMMLWAKDDESDKKIYKLDSNLGEYIEQMYKK